MRFVSRRVEPAGERAWRIACDLTIAGVTRPVELQATARRADDGDGLAFAVRGSLRRSQFGIDPKSLLEAGVSDRVDVTLRHPRAGALSAAHHAGPTAPAS